jgi:hypothetical protein
MKPWDITAIYAAIHMFEILVKSRANEIGYDDELQ